jgi:SAM-dependent methyltransferase
VSGADESSPTDELTQGADRISLARAVARSFSSLRRRGIRPTLSLIFRFVPEWWFDVRNGTSTSGFHFVHELEHVGDSAGYPYLGSNPGDLRRALEELDHPAKGTFVDLGCGKGRALVIAARHGYSSVVGVEFVADFCETARENFAAFQRRTGNSCEVEVLHQDAAAYLPGPDTSTFFFYNPFPAEVVAAAAQNIHDSWRTHPRDVRVIYARAEHAEVFEDSPRWRRAGESRRTQDRTVAYVPVAG